MHQTRVVVDHASPAASIDGWQWLLLAMHALRRLFLARARLTRAMRPCRA
jgi:hypothetical protein